MPTGKHRGVELTDPIPMRERIANLEKSVADLQSKFDRTVPVLVDELQESDKAKQGSD